MEVNLQDCKHKLTIEERKKIPCKLIGNGWIANKRRRNNKERQKVETWLKTMKRSYI